MRVTGGASFPSKIEGGQKEVWVEDMTATRLLTDILKELKKMNIHLSKLSDENITNMEVE